MRLSRLIWFDLRYQWRHYYYLVYLIVCSVYVGILYAIPDAYTDHALILFTFSDPSALGLLLAGSIVLLERDQGLWLALFSTPLRAWEYMVSKCLSLGFLSLMAALSIHLAVNGLPESPFAFILGISLTSFFFTILGMAAALNSRSINGFLIRSQLYALPFTLPILDYLEAAPIPFIHLLPTKGSLILISGAANPVSPGAAGYAAASLTLWISCAGIITMSILIAITRQRENRHGSKEV
jgi:fluoroquinolone transport system permease protein